MIEPPARFRRRWMLPPKFDGSAIRITAVETTVVNAELRNWIFVKVRTDQDGLYGWARRASTGRRER